MISRSSLIFFAGALVVALLIVAGLFAVEGDESPLHRTNEDHSKLPSQPTAHDQKLIRPVAPRATGVPVFTPSGIAFIEVTAEGYSQPGAVVQITGENRGSDAYDNWENLAYTAAYIALTTMNNPPKGIRVGIFTNSATPSIEQLTPLTLAIFMAIRGEQYPPNILVTDLIALGGLLFNLHRADRMAHEAKKHGLTFMTATSVSDLVAQWSESQNPVSKPVPAGDTIAPPMNVASQIMQQNLPRALSDLTRGNTVHRPLPEGWSKVRERLLSKLRQANPRSSVELLDVALVGAKALEAVRLAEFGAKMLGPFTERITRRKLRKPKHWEMAWLVLLLECRFDGEQAVKDSIGKIPQGALTKPLAVNEWLTTQQQQITAVNSKMEQLLKRLIKPRAKQPKPYPWHDARHITWTKSKTTEAPTTTTTWGVAVSRFYLLWAQLIISRTIDPERNLDVAASGALVVEDEPHLEGLVVMAQSQLKSQLGFVLKTLGDVPKAISNMVTLGALHPNAEVHERVTALERALIALGFAQQALILQKHLDNSVN